jgi:Flp pilus assembly protein TadB
MIIYIYLFDDFIFNEFQEIDKEIEKASKEQEEQLKKQAEVDARKRKEREEKEEKLRKQEELEARQRKEREDHQKKLQKQKNDEIKEKQEKAKVSLLYFVLHLFIHCALLCYVSIVA